MGQEFGGIRGTVLDADFEVPIAAAEVSIAESGAVATGTDDGNYIFSEVPPGTYTLVFSKSGYTRQVTADVVVTAGQLTEVNATLAGEFVELEEFVVQELTFASGTEAALLELRFEAPALMDSVSTELMSQAGAGDAASALTLVSGATVEDGKYPVIRGLPDRYVNSQINGVRLPTADSEKRAVALDQFPSAAIESIQVSKTFTPDQQGDASGGAVNVVLKGLPEENYLKVSGSSSYNTNVSGTDEFLSYSKGGVDFDAKDDGGRDTSTQPLGANWDGATGAKYVDAPTDYKWSVTGGLRHELSGDVDIGGLASIFYERDSSHYENGIDDAYWVRQGDEELTPQFSQGSPEQDEFITSLYDVQKSSQEVRYGGLGVVGVETEDHAVSLTGLYTRDASDEVTIAEDTRGKEFFFPGYDPNDPTSPGFGSLQAAPYNRLETLSYSERETVTTILAGKHTLPDPGLAMDGFVSTLEPELDWRLAQSSASEYEPDKRQFGSAWIPGRQNPGIPPFLPPSTVPPQHYQLKPDANFSLGNLQRSTRDIEEKSRQGAVDLKQPFENWTDDEGYVKAGFFTDRTKRFYDQDSFSNFNDNDSSYIGDWEDRWAPNFSDEDHPITAATIDVDYEGRQEIDAWYYMADIPVTDWLAIIGGYRYEQTKLSIVNTPEQDVLWYPPPGYAPTLLNPGDADVSYRQDDVLPSIGFKIEPTEEVTFRGNYSETVARQTFRELTPIQQQEFAGGDVFIGNPDLQMSALRNYDLRLDYRPWEGSLLSASYFIKEVDQPIEYVQRASSFTFTTPTNYPEGEILGWEFEARQDLDRFWDELEGLAVGANLTLIESEVTLPADDAAALERAGYPAKTRDMTNAPEYLYNLYTVYELDRLGLKGTSLALFYTVRGDTLIAGAGESRGNYIPSVYETEFGTLNASLGQKIGEGLEIKFQAKNLLDPEIETVYRDERVGGDKTKSSYNKGMEFSLGVSASF